MCNQDGERMNTKDAIDIINEYIFYNTLNPTVKEALHRAITALKKDNNAHSG